MYVHIQFILSISNIKNYKLVLNVCNFNLLTGYKRIKLFSKFKQVLTTLQLNWHCNFAI